MDVKEEITQFIKKHFPEFLSELDDVILDYLNGVVLEALSTCHHKVSDELIEELRGVFSGYLPAIEELPQDSVVTFANSAIGQVKGQKEPTPEKSPLQSTIINNKPTTPVSLPTQPTDNNKPTTQQPPSKTKPASKAPSKPLSPEAMVLQELFPELGSDKLARVLQDHKGNIELAAQTLLDGSYHDPQNEDSVIVKSVSIDKLDSKERNQILSKYQDVEEDEGKIHRPVLKDSSDGQKKLRYRDNMIVTEKGAKYIVVKDEVEEEKMKNTYISLKIKTKGKRGPGTKKV